MSESIRQFFKRGFFFLFIIGTASLIPEARLLAQKMHPDSRIPPRIQELCIIATSYDQPPEERQKAVLELLRLKHPGTPFGLLPRLSRFENAPADPLRLLIANLDFSAAMPMVFHWLEMDDREKPFQAVSILEYLPTPDALEPLIRTMDQGGYFLKSAAARALMKLCRQLKGEEEFPFSPEKKEHILARLREPGEAIMKLLFRTLYSSREAVREASLLVLELNGGTQTVEPLVRAIGWERYGEAEHVNIALRAVISIVRQKPETVEMLKQMARDTYRGLRAPALRVLAKCAPDFVRKMTARFEKNAFQVHMTEAARYYRENRIKDHFSLYLEKLHADCSALRESARALRAGRKVRNRSRKQ